MYKNIEDYKAYRLANATKRNEQVKQWVIDNRERKRQLDKEYHLRNKGNPEYLAKRRLHEANRRVKKLQATPKWLTEEHKLQIRHFYMNCPEGYQVDHIVPLQGKNVNGLHTPWNLQWLPSIINKTKSNKVF